MSPAPSPPGPHLFAASFCVGLAAALALRAPPAQLAFATLGLALAAVVHARGRTAWLVAALAAAGWWWGSARLDGLDRSLLADRISDTALARLEITGPARQGAFALRVPVRVRAFDRLGLSERSRLELPLGRAPPQGAVIEAVVRVARPREPEDGFSEETYLRRQGVHVVLRASSFRVVGRRGGLPGVADRLRERLGRTIGPGLGGERRALVAGVVLGEDEGLELELRDRFRASGLYHLLAVSGQNIAYVVGGVLVLAWILGIPRWAGELGALGAVLGYVLAVGWQPSVVRAGIAGALASLAWLAARPRDRWYFLLVGAAVLLAWNPYALLEPGFQLSFGAVAAIFVLVPKLERRLEGYPLPTKLATVIAVSGACGAATAPILWLHFGAVPIYSVLSNALAAPVVAPLLGMALGAAAIEPVIPGAAEALAWANGWLAAYLAFCARLIGGLPYAQVSSWQALTALALLLGATMLVLRLRVGRGRRALALAGMALALGVGWRLGPRTEPPPPPDGLRMTFLDVGQGDATLIEVPEGAVLIDQGPPEARVADRLRSLGVKRLALLVMSHPSRDNIGGAEAVVEHLAVDLVLDPDLPFENPFGEPALAEARRRGVDVAVARAGQSFRLGRLTLRVLWPDSTPSGSADPNDHATVLLASYGEIDALLPADAESNVTLPLRPPPVEIIKVGHHGSADDGLPELLDLTEPEIAIVSVGVRNDYGHPAPSTTSALARAAGLAVYRTDRDGTITLESDGRRLWLRTAR